MYVVLRKYLSLLFFPHMLDPILLFLALINAVRLDLLYLKSGVNYYQLPSMGKLRVVAELFRLYYHNFFSILLFVQYCNSNNLLRMIRSFNYVILNDLLPSFLMVFISFGKSLVSL